MAAITKNCRRHGQIFEKDIIIRKTNDREKPNVLCRLCKIENDKKSYQKNREKRYQKNLEWTRKNKDKMKLIRARVFQKHKEKIYVKNKIRSKNHTENASDHYLRMILSRSGKFEYKTIPQWLIEIKRVLLLIKRELKELKKP